MSQSLLNVTFSAAHHGQDQESNAPAISHIIALHGLGARVDDLKSVATAMHLPQVHWHFLAAPIQPVSINAGVLMPSWFDIYGFKETSPVDHEGIRKSCQLVFTQIQELMARGVKPKHIALLGFSQGGVIALHSALSAPWQMGAVIALSTWLPASEPLTLAGDYQHLPIWLAHGFYDDVVPPSAAQHAKEKLLALGMRSVTLTQWPIGHSICHESLAVLKEWLLAKNAQ